MNGLDLCLGVVSWSCQPLRYIRRWISRKPLEIEAWFQWTTNRKWHMDMGYQMGTWPMTSRLPRPRAVWYLPLSQTFARRRALWCLSWSQTLCLCLGLYDLFLSIKPSAWAPGSTISALVWNPLRLPRSWDLWYLLGLKPLSWPWALWSLPCLKPSASALGSIISAWSQTSDSALGTMISVLFSNPLPRPWALHYLLGLKPLCRPWALRSLPWF